MKKGEDISECLLIPGNYLEEGDDLELILQMISDGFEKEFGISDEGIKLLNMQAKLQLYRSKIILGETFYQIKVDILEDKINKILEGFNKEDPEDSVFELMKLGYKIDVNKMSTKQYYKLINYTIKSNGRK